MKFLLVALNAKYIHSNPGIYSLKTYAEHMQKNMDAVGQAGVRIEIAEYTINHQNEQVLEDIYLQKPDVLGLSCYIWNITYVLELVHDLHKVLPETDIWLGGPEVSYDACRLLEQEPDILGVMKGEGEESFACLVQCYKMPGRSVWKADADTVYGFQDFWMMMEKISGLAYRDASGEIHDNEARSAMDMSRIPFPYMDLERFENKIVYYESSRGCPFSCSYCLSSIDKSVRFRDIGLVKRELIFFLERRVPQVKFVDRTFNCNKRHAMEIWRFIFENDNGVTNFHFEIAGDLLDQEELELLHLMRPGLIQLEIGVQSVNPRTLGEIRRSMDLEKLKRTVAQINRGHNIHQHLDLIVGLPYEDFESFRGSFNEVYEMRPEQLQMGFLKVLKGSYMYEMAKQYDLVWRQQPPYEVLSTRWISYGETAKLKRIENMLEVHYNSGQFATTLRLLEREFTDPFSMYEALAGYYDKNKLNNCSHSRMARYEILHRFITEQIESRSTGTGALPGLSDYEDALMCDLYLRENCKSRPSFALDQAPYKEQIRMLLPQLRSLGAMVHAEVMRSGVIWLFDYRIRDPLTGNASQKQLGNVLSKNKKRACGI